MRKDFKFGVATSSLQIEGTKGKFKTIWDLPENNVLDQSNCKDACNFFNTYKDDVQLIKNLGVDVYRMSLSWARICPNEFGFSKEGINFYHHLFKELKNNGILVDVTLYHWDMPLWLYEKGIGFHSKEIVEYFLEYAKKMFSEFDQYVHSWATLNEPWCISRVGYLYGTHAPFITNDAQKTFQTDYYMLLAHAAVYHFYKENYNKNIGIVLNVWGNHPNSNSKEDLKAAQLAHQFYEGVYLNPLFVGGFSNSYLDMVSKLGVNTEFVDAKALTSVKDTTDFLGINYYMHNTVIYDSKEPLGFKCIQTSSKLTDMGWEVYPKGLEYILRQIREEYTTVPITITENGSAYKDIVKNGIINDVERIEYFKKHFKVIESISETLNIEGYYLWSLMDNFEWHFGYTKRFGIVYVDYKTMKRIPKQSYYEYKKLIAEKRNI